MRSNGSSIAVFWSGLLVSVLLAVAPAVAEPPSEPASAADVPTSAQSTAAPADTAQEAPAPAASDPAEPEAYRDIVGAALREYGEHHFEESRALFVQAHELFPNARTLRGLGMVEFERRNYLASIAYLEEALASTVRPLDDALRADTTALLERARTFVGTVRLEVAPAHAQVLVDGTPVEPSQELHLVAGEHVIEAHARSYVHESRRISVTGADVQRVAFALVRMESAPAHSDAGSRRSVWKSPWLWTTVGVALVAVGVGVAYATRGTEVHVAEPEPTPNTKLILQAFTRSGP